MTPLEDLNYFLSNIIQWILFFIGSLLVLIPIYHTLNNKSSTFLKASLICKQRLGMHRFSNLYNYNNKKQIDSFSALDISDRSTAITAVAILGLLKDINKLDTQVCLLPSNNNDETLLVSGLVNTGNSCFLNSVLQVRLFPYIYTPGKQALTKPLINSLYLLYQNFMLISAVLTSHQLQLHTTCQ